VSLQLRERLDKERPFTRSCCNDVHNLRYALDVNNRKDVIVLRCKHCGALHHRVYAELPTWKIE